jgi:hypothetical protein
MRLRSMKSGVNADTAIGVFSSLVSRFCAVTITSSSPIDGSVSAVVDAASDESEAASAFAITVDGNMAAAASPNMNNGPALTRVRGPTDRKKIISATVAQYAIDLMPAFPPYIDCYDQYIVFVVIGRGNSTRGAKPASILIHIVNVSASDSHRSIRWGSAAARSDQMLKSPVDLFRRSPALENKRGPHQSTSDL